MTKNNITVLALHGDTHAGNSLGLFNPDCEFEDQDKEGNLVKVKYQLGVYQGYLWELFTEHVRNAFDIAGNNPLYVAHVGDKTQGIRFLDNLCANTLSAQVKIAVENDAPWFSGTKKPVGYFQILGTGSHVNGEGTTEKIAVSQLQIKYPKTKFELMYHGIFNFKGAMVDLAHHGPSSGGRKWLEGNVAGWMAKSQMLDDVLMGETPPHLIVRGHVHEYRRNVQILYTGDDREFETHTIILPSYCGLGDYGHKATRSEYLIQNGMVVVVFENGKIIKVVPMVKTVDIRRKVVIE